MSISLHLVTIITNVLCFITIYFVESGVRD